MKLVKEHINEKFEETTDPVEDLGIGFPKIKQMWKDAYKTEGRISAIESSMEYFGNDKYIFECWAIYDVLGDLSSESCNSFTKAQKYAIKSIVNSKKKFFENHQHVLKTKKIVEVLYKFYQLDLRHVKFRT